MRKLLNTLYVSTQGSYLHKEGETVIVEQGQQKLLQLPIHTIGNIICFGNVLCSPYLLGLCAERDISVSYMTEYGRFLASVNGPVRGNVLLRRQQYRQTDNPEKTKSIAANIVAAKLANSRVVLNRAQRDHGMKTDLQSISDASEQLSGLIRQIDRTETTDELRGIEGTGAARYFGVFNHLIIDQKEGFYFKERSRRPPLDAVNAMLSFTYTILTHDIRSALETVGLDPAVGFLHRDRPGRPSLALDLLEEFRSVIADRLVLSLINRRQVSPAGFTIAENGAVVMDTDTRKILLTEYQNRKQKEVYHPYIEEKVQIGLLFFVQANLLARHIRGDIDGYPPFFWR
ncbi:subtype I-C CRISPR-associated endonuclease Cas1 [Marispirochaeta aestuarii]|uniref:CRISPR-associated endonuclease Cas1 n=1 Tax=Marispirochaeta aestuarii TaxID=1963862 RepID=A0A1Y1RVY1_9SPIO|nr:type I-C CRISPR-associated endonuclease Cas1c [Marispirochaeta aestuarii]ORC32843.1 subtype I-C CRISPR-associated endonuclease Cas1 [Marispirochaeta aestuarii]